MTFAEVVGSLQRYDEAPVGTQAPAIFVAEPWAPLSEATVEWSDAKGGVPFGRKPILFYLTTVKAALRILGSEYDALVTHGEVEAMCRKLAHHVTEMNAQRVRHDIDIASTNIADMPGEFSKVGFIAFRRGNGQPARRRAVSMPRTGRASRPRPPEILRSFAFPLP